MRKKFIICIQMLLLLYLACLSIVQYQRIEKASITAKANGQIFTYARIQQDCYLYEKEAEDSGIFILPESYYVKILKRGNVFHQVSYLDDSDFATAVYGYVLASTVKIIENYTPENPYLEHKLTVTFKVSTALYNIAMQNELLEIRLDLPFYGISRVNTKTYNYVNYNNQVVSVDAKACSAVNYQKHPDSFVQNTNSSNNINTAINTPTPTQNYTPLIVIGGIVGLGLLGLGISYFIFNGSKKQKRIQVFDELDEMDEL